MVKLVKANIHKDRAVLTAFLLILILSTLLLHTGLFVNQYGSIYDRKAEEAGLGDAIAHVYGEENRIDNALKDVDVIKEYSVTDVVSPAPFEYTTSRSKEEKSLKGGIFYRLGDYGISEEFHFLERDDTVSGKRIYLNLYTACCDHLHVGDKIHLTSDNFGDHEYTIAGIYEDLFNGNTYTFLSFMLEEEAYNELKERSDELMAEGTEYAGWNMLLYRFVDGTDPDKGLKMANTALEAAGIETMGWTRELHKTAYTTVSGILAAFMTAFSVVIMGICFIMIIFTVSNNIDRDIRNIGALRAVGYTTGQVRAALILEFLGLGAVGSGIGIGLSYLLFPVIENKLLRQVTGLIWENGFYPGITCAVFAGTAAVIVFVVVCSTRKIKNLHPATALRFGLAAHTFKKNHLPLCETKGSLNVLLALKSTLQSMGQNVIIFGILLAVSFMTMFSGTLFYNTRVDITNFQRLLQGDVADGYVTINASSEEEMYDLIEQLQGIDGVSQAYGLESDVANVKDNEATLIYVSRPEYVYCGVYEGDMVREANEAVLGSVIAKKAGVGIGDEVVIERGDHKAAFLVTGLQQAVYGFGERIYITDEGAKRLGMNLDYSDIRLRLEEPSAERVDAVLSEAEELLGSRCIGTDNTYRYSRSNENVPVYVVGFLILLLILLNVITVLLVIRLLLKTVFIRREKEFGIKKAVGFTSGQLRFQLSLSLMPVCMLAALFGGVMGYFLINPLFALIFGGFGIRNADLIVCPVLIVFTIVIVTLLVFGFSFLLSGRMKRVSAYQLIQE